MSFAAQKFLAACVVGAGLLLQAPAAMADGSAGTLKLATSVGYPPFEFMDDQGQIAGFDIDIGNAICAHLKKTCSWENIDFSGIVPALKARKFDAVIASIAITPERQKQVDFSDPVYKGSSRLVAHKDSGLELTLDSLKGKRVGVEQGTTNDKHAKAEWAPHGVEVVVYANQDLAIADMKLGRIDAISTSGLQAAVGFLAEEAGKDYAFVGGVIPGTETDGSGIAVTKGNTELVAEFNKGLAAIRADGTYDTIAAKYFPSTVSLMGE